MKAYNRLLRYIYLLIPIILFIIGQPVYAANNVVEDCFNDSSNCDDLYSDEQVGDDRRDDMSDDINEPLGLEGDQNTPSLFSSFVKMIFALILILGLIYIMLKFINRRHQLFQQTQSLENLGGISVGQNKSIQIIRVGSKFYLIGVGDNVQLLKEIEDEAMKEALRNKQVEEPLSFKQWLKTLLPLQTKQTKQDEENSFNNILVDELSKMKENRQKMIDRFDKKEDTHE